MADEQEVEDLQWLIEQVQAVSDLPICINSPNSNSCVAAMKFCNKPDIINAVSMEGDKIDVVFSTIAETDWLCVALLCASGIPASAAERLHIDPLVEMRCTSMNGISLVTEVMREIKKQYPTIHITSAVSNISFNLPLRKILNQTFAVLSISAGMDSAVLDPTNKDLLASILAAEAMLGEDLYCMNYIRAYKAGCLSAPK